MEIKKRKVLGCIADDFTGAGDAASFLRQGGLRTVLFNGIPKADVVLENDYDAVVIALKTRTMERMAAVEESLAACRRLVALGATQLYFKYCSTFDSTPQGNIGSVLDGMMEEFQGERSVICPALPINNRVVLGGRIYVDGIPLQESPMKNHPLTPMWDCQIAKLMEPQGKFQSLTIDACTLMGEREKIDSMIVEMAEKKRPYYVIPDYITEQHGKRIVEIFGDDHILSGGSGLLAHLAAHLAAGQSVMQTCTKKVLGKGLILVGSCSEMTLKQIAAFQKHGGVSYQILPVSLLQGQESIDHIWEFIKKYPDQDVLVYTSQEAVQVKNNQQYGREVVAEIVEQTMAALGGKAVKAGFQRIIVAGGETSGAVIRRLGFDGFSIGESVAPGVPLLSPLGKREMLIVLKSGNFGDEYFFQRAVKMMGGYL